MGRWDEPEDRDHETDEADEQESPAAPAESDDDEDSEEADEADEAEADEAEAEADEAEADEAEADEAEAEEDEAEAVEAEAVEAEEEAEEVEDSFEEGVSDLVYEDDLEDEFADFIDEELGYADIDWDTIPQKQLDEHERIRALSQEELDGLELKRTNDLHRWAAARAYLAHGDEAAFESLAQPLLRSKRRSKALDYVDIALALMSRKARRGDFEGAFAMLEPLKALSKGDDDLVKRFQALLTIQRGDQKEGLELLAQLAETKPDDPAFLLSLGEDLCGIGLWEEAVEYLEIAEELARERGDQDLLASIENAVQFAQRRIGFEDVEDE